MKLYTEEQLNEIIDIAEFNKHLTNDDILKEFTPIELPTDEEIDIYVKSHKYDDMFENLLEYGAKWMRDKIINQIK